MNKLIAYIESKKSNRFKPEVLAWVADDGDANIHIQDRVVTINGVEKLNGAPVDGLDIRAAAAVVLAGLAAEGRSEVHEPHHLRRGYEHFERKIGALGAHVWARISDPDDFIFAGC